MAALQYVDVPGYAAILFRRTYRDLALPGALMDRAESWLRPTSARWNPTDKMWTFPSGASLSFGYLDNENTRYRYQSAEFQFCGFDELTQFNESVYRYLFSRLRRLKNAVVPIRMRSASNPGGIGHDWVKQRFIVEGRAKGRTFIPAKLDDNPHVDQVEYLKALEQLDPVTRAQLLSGDWGARTVGDKFRREWFEIVDEVPAQVRLRLCRYWDFAGTEARPGEDPDYTAGALVGQFNGVFYILDIKRARQAPGRIEELVRQTAELDGRSVIVGIEQEPGSSGVAVIDRYQRTVLLGWAVVGDRVTGDKVTRANPISAAAYAGNVKLLRGPWISDWLDEAEAFPNGAHDDQVDAVSGASNQLVKPLGIPAILAQAVARGWSPTK